MSCLYNGCGGCGQDLATSPLSSVLISSFGVPVMIMSCLTLNKVLYWLTDCRLMKLSTRMQMSSQYLPYIFRDVDPLAFPTEAGSFQKPRDT